MLVKQFYSIEMHLGMYINQRTHSALFRRGVVEEFEENPMDDGILQHCPVTHRQTILFVLILDTNSSN